MNNFTSLDIHIDRVKLEEAIKQENHEEVERIIKFHHPRDVADMIQSLHIPLIQYFVKNFYHLITPQLISELNQSIREILFDNIDIIKLVDIFEDLESDDALEIFENLDDIQQGRVLRSLSKRNRMMIQSTLSFPQKSAARLMQNDVPSVRCSWNVRHALNYVKYTEDKFDYVADIFVVDNEQRLIGSVSMYSLIKSDGNNLIKNIMNPHTMTVSTNTDQEDVANIFRKYSLLCAPVIDYDARLVGMITADDIFKVVEEETIEDFAGVRKANSDFYAPIVSTSFSRLRWLIITAVSSLLSSFVISRYDFVLSQNVYLSILLPIVAAMGGAYGLQVNTVIIRAIATSQLVSTNIYRTFIKEISISFINGFFFAVCLSFLSFLWLADFTVSIILFAGILFNMFWAGIVGSLYPIILHRFNLDPALSAGPLVGMSTDIFGFVVFLSIADAVL